MSHEEAQNAQYVFTDFLELLCLLWLKFRHNCRLEGVLNNEESR